MNVVRIRVLRCGCHRGNASCREVFCAAIHSIVTGVVFRSLFNEVKMQDNGNSFPAPSQGKFRGVDPKWVNLWILTLFGTGLARESPHPPANPHQTLSLPISHASTTWLYHSPPVLSWAKRKQVVPRTFPFHHSIISYRTH